MHHVLFSPFAVFDFSTRQAGASWIEALGLLFFCFEKAILSTAKVSGATVEIMDTPYLHDSYNLVGYTIPNIDRISLWGLGLVFNLYVKEIPEILVGYDCILFVITYSVRDMDCTL